MVKDSSLKIQGPHSVYHKIPKHEFELSLKLLSQYIREFIKEYLSIPKKNNSYTIKHLQEVLRIIKE